MFDVYSSEWKPAVELAAIDCAPVEGQKVCIDYGITGYPTIKVLLKGLSKHR